MINLSEDENFVKFDLNSSLLKNDSSLYETVLKETISYYNTHIDEALLFTSKNSLLHAIAKYMALFAKVKEIIIYSPISKDYEEVFSLYGFKISIVNTCETSKVKVPENSFVIFSNPNELDGKYKNVKELFTYWEKQNCFIFISEELFDYCLEVSCTSFINTYKNLFVFKSFENFFYRTDIKTTTLISSKQNIEKLKLYEAKDNISFFDLNYIHKLLEDNNHILVCKAINAKNKKLLEDIFSNKNIFEEFISSDTNFLLVKVLPKVLSKFLHFTQSNKINIKDCSTYESFDKSYFKVFVKSSKDLKKFAKLLENF